MYLETTPNNNMVQFRYQNNPDYDGQVIDLANLKQDLVVKLTLTDGVWTADHTYADIAQAIANGVLVRITDETHDRYAVMGGYTDNSYIFVTNDTDYCYAYIVTNEDAWSMREVLEGEDGVGIADITLNADYTLTLTMTDGSQYTVGPIRGAQGEQGPQGVQGAQGPQGIQGPAGPTGNGIASALLNDNYTLTLTFTDGTTYTTPSLRGPQGIQGERGLQGLQGVQGPQGDKGDTGATGPQGPMGITGPQGPKGDKGDKGATGDTPQITADSDGIIYVDGQVLTEAVKDAADLADAAADTANDAAAAADTAREAIQTDLEKKANIDGYYKTLVAGSAERLLAETTQESEFTFDKIPAAADDGAALLKNVKGRSLVWNQLADQSDFPNANRGGVVWSHDSDGIITANGTATAEYEQLGGWLKLDTDAIPAGHKMLIYRYLVSGTVTGVLGFDYDANKTTTGEAGLAFIKESAVGSKSLVWYYSGAVFTNAKIKFGTIDLTLMFGAGNEPATVAEFVKLYAQMGYGYNAGTILSNKTASVKLVGFNQWDEEWEGGTINISTGGDAASSTAIRSKNYIPVIPNTNYYLKFPADPRIAFYDANKNFISSLYSSTANTVITTPSNCAFIRFGTYSTYGNTYHHDLCINISDASRNGEYEPYKTDTLTLNLATMTGKLNGEGSSVVVFPDGMRQAGTVYDEAAGGKAVVRLAEVDLGSLTWDGGGSTGFNLLAEVPGKARGIYNIKTPLPYRIEEGQAGASFMSDKSIGGNNANSYIYVKDTSYASAADFKAAMAGVPLIYELETPLEYVLDTPLPDTFQAYKGGTMMQLPQNGSAPTTAPMVMVAQYPMDAVAAINYILQVLQNNNLS